MEDIKFKGQCKNLDGSVDVSDVTLDESGVTFVNSVVPSPSAGTKFYKHTLEDGNYIFILITTSSQPLDFTTLDTHEKLHNYLLTQTVISFTLDMYPVVYREYADDNCYYYICPFDDDSTPLMIKLDDWYLSTTTDTVTEL